MVSAVAQVCILLSVAAPTPAYVPPSILPGTYAMEWAASDYAPGTPGCMGELQPLLPTEPPRFEGIASDNAWWGQSGQFIVIVDESAGTGGGYDTMYVLCNCPAEGTVSVADAVRIPLVRRGRSDEPILLPADESAGCAVDLAFGEPPNTVSRTLVFDAAASLQDDESGRLAPAYYALMFRGGWYGYVRTSAGKVRVMTLDANTNGRFDDTGSDGEEADGVLLLRESHLLDDRVFLGQCGEVLLTGGKYFTLDISPAGDSFSLLPYSQELVTLNILTGTGSAAVKCRSVHVQGSVGAYSFGEPAGSISLPAMTRPEIGIEADFAPGCTAPRDLTATVSQTLDSDLEPGSTFVVDLTAPLTMKIHPGSPEVKAGEEYYIGISFLLGGNPMYIQSSRTTAVNVRGKSGKLLMSTKSGFG